LNELGISFRSDIEIKPVFNNRNILHNAVIYINPAFINVNRLIFKGSVFISTNFVNINKLITSLSNCQNTTWERFGEVWSGCSAWASLLTYGIFVNRNKMLVKIGFCDDTSWDRFRGTWEGCEVWVI
jgi:hypothetical protein